MQCLQRGRAVGNPRAGGSRAGAECTSEANAHAKLQLQTRNCSLCHVNSTEQNDLSLTGLLPVTDPQGPINPVQPFTSACTGCHVDIASASHALSNTTVLGEACNVCHGSGAAYAVDQVHAQY